MKRFDGKVSAVTGVSPGIGEAVARRFAAERGAEINVPTGPAEKADISARGRITPERLGSIYTAP